MIQNNGGRFLNVLFYIKGRHPINYLSQRCVSGHAREERLLITEAEIQVNSFVCKGGEFIAKADFINSFHGGGVR